MPKQKATLSVALNDKLVELQEIYGFKFDMKVDVGRITVKLTDPSEAKAEFERVAPAFGVDPKLYGRRFKHKNTLYEVIGIRKSAPKNCLQIKAVHSGQEYSCAPSFIR